jgi:hypothetical protein
MNKLKMYDHKLHELIKTDPTIDYKLKTYTECITDYLNNLNESKIYSYEAPDFLVENIFKNGILVHSYDGCDFKRAEEDYYGTLYEFAMDEITNFKLNLLKNNI